MELLYVVSVWRPRRAAKRTALLSQLVLLIACELEQTLKHAATEGSGTRGGLIVERSEFNLAACALQQLNGQLVRYLDSQRELFVRPPTMLSLASDKSRVHGLSLMSMVIALPNDAASWCMPVVPLGLVPEFLVGARRLWRKNTILCPHPRLMAEAPHLRRRHFKR